MSDEAELQFRRGYCIATANIIRTHGADVVAEDVLRGYGEINFTGIDEFDVATLRPIADEIKRKATT
jgi:hypothetical protein